MATGVTIRGLATLARNCRHLWRLCIHFRTDSVVKSVWRQDTPPRSENGTAARQHGCDLTDLEVGETPIWGGKAKMVSKGLLQIFPPSPEYQTRWGIVVDS